MIFLEKNLYNAYNWVKEDAASKDSFLSCNELTSDAEVQGCSIIIYAAPDCDSLCSLRILTVWLTNCSQVVGNPLKRLCCKPIAFNTKLSQCVDMNLSLLLLTWSKKMRT